MRSGKKAVSCIPCAKRKVRCDKLQPCCHCRRRQHDECVYPELNLAHSGQLEQQAKRIERLEQYIRSLGGDPKEVNQSENRRERNNAQMRESADDSMISVDQLGSKISSSRTTEASFGKISSLVTHDEELTYIET